MGEIISVIAMRPVTFFIVLTIAVLFLPCMLIPYWYQLMKNVEHDVKVEANYAQNELLVTKIKNTGKLILPVNSSAFDIARLLDPVLQNKKISFMEIQTKVAPALFEAQMIIPHLTQASYIGLNGLFFSYFIDHDHETYALYSNSSFASNSNTWYIQLVDSKNGALLGEAQATNPIIVTKETWFQRAMSSPNGYASLGFRWLRETQEKELDLFLDTASLGEVGAISLGFVIKEVIDVFSSIDLKGGSLYMATLDDHDGKVLLQGIKNVGIEIKGDKALIQDGNNVSEISCKTIHDDVANGEGTILHIGGNDVIFYCSQIDIARVPLVFVLAFPSKGLVSNVHEKTKMALMLLILIMVVMVIAIFAFMAMIIRAARREVHLCAAYMMQVEKTSQAERKSMKQSLAFARANHDVRGYLACIKSLVELSYIDVSSSSFSELGSNLRKINDCAEELLALVNSILDFSKIEAGKMQLEEKEFNLAQLVEDIVDLHHPVAMKKGIDVILDPCDGSIMKFCHVKGDQAKLKQILSNLLSNAVKFTSQGHIIIRARARKPSLESSIIASNKNDLLNRLSRFFYNNKKAYNEVEEMMTIKKDPNCLEFEFEVEDTGPGIPKDKRQSIFENFVQVKENSAGQIGTGLGLGIVQSLVRLMGGDIEVVDKANGETGSCFKFNIFLISQDVNNAPMDNTTQDKRECQDTYPGSRVRCCGRSSTRVEPSIVVLLIKNEERRQMVKRHMKSLGIKLVIVRQASQFSHILKKKVKSKFIASQYNASSSRSSNLIPPQGSLREAYKKDSNQRSIRCILLIIDANAGDFQELCRSVAEFRKDHNRECCIKVVWLDRPENRKDHFPGLENDSLPPTDCIISEPFHGSRLTRVIGLLPEFGGKLLRIPSIRTTPITTLLSSFDKYSEELDSSSSDQEPFSWKKNTQVSCKDDAQQEAVVKLKSSSIGNNEPSTENKDNSSSEKPLLAKKILVVGNGEEMKKVANCLSSNLGGVVDQCHNGKEAVEIVCKALKDQNPTPSRLPYDYIVMQTEMEVMNGYDATNLIRTEESKYGIHIPILALTSETSSAERERIVNARMDFHMTTPYTDDVLLEAFRSVEKKSAIAKKPIGSQDVEVKNNVGALTSRKPLVGKKFLIAEDILMLRRVAELFLSGLGACVEHCNNGKEAFELICEALSRLNGGGQSEFPYDYVLMDCKMPIMDGFEATKKIREEEKNYNIYIPIIALTADEREKDRGRIIEAGMDFHLTKPLERDKLLNTLSLIDEKLNNVEN